jgi:CDP-glucose 4,6-dehydratase
MIAPFCSQLARVYAGRNVLVTGHTGFKGTWLTMWLAELGARVTGFALAPETRPALFEVIRGSELCRSVIGDVRDGATLRKVIGEARPDVVFHLAAQALVRASYEEPIGTLETNVLGTANVLEALRLEACPCAAVIVTTDKCYESRESVYGFREDEPLGGHDPYSTSKAAAELVVASYRRSFFPPARIRDHGIAVASARAGNVIGGGDWSRDRLVVDCVRALALGEPIQVRNPSAIRPWQHVLEPLGGYLLLGARLLEAPPETAPDLCQAWNFGPRSEDTRSVRELADRVVDAWGKGAWEEGAQPGAPHEAGTLRLCTEKAQLRLCWSPRWSFDEAVERTVEWYRAFHRGATPMELAALSRAQIRDYGRA